MDVAAAVEEARRPMSRPRMPAVPLALRLRTSPALRGLVPSGAVLARAERVAGQRWRDQDDRDRAIATMETILAGTRRAGETVELARQRLIDDEANRAIFWAPWRFPEPSEATAERVRTLLESKRPLVFSGCHLGPYFQQFAALPGYGVDVISVGGGWHFAEATPDLWGRRLARWVRGLADAGLRRIPAPGSFEPLRALLELGEPVALNFDVPGSFHTQFLGKPVDLASGTSRLAHLTGALVVPMLTRREGMLARVELLAPLDARDFQTPAELHEALAAVHEGSVLAFPHTLEDPGRPGSWESGASPACWRRPEAV